MKMLFLDANQVRGGYLGDAVEHSAFLQPDHHFGLVMKDDAGLGIVFPSGYKNPWAVWPVKDDDRDLQGLIIPGLTFEVDPNSIIAGDEGAPGDLITRNGVLCLRCNQPDGFLGRAFLSTGIKVTVSEHVEVGFRNWRCVLRDGEDRRIIAEVHNSKVTSQLGCPL